MVFPISDCMLLSILICTIESRSALFNRIYNKLMSSVNRYGLSSEIEIVYVCDNGELSTGQKRNDLVAMSKGEYICFVDDDDDVSEEYIPLIYAGLASRPDCIGLTGIITVNGRNPKKFIHSVKYTSYFEEQSVYYRPPNHLNPIRKEIAKGFVFPDKDFGEDTNWAMKLCQSGLLKREHFISTPLYYYLFIPKTYKRR